MEKNESHIQYCVTYAIRYKMKAELYSVHYNYCSFETVKEAKDFYNEILQHEYLYTANLCKVIKTTE